MGTVTRISSHIIHTELSLCEINATRRISRNLHILMNLYYVNRPFLPNPNFNNIAGSYDDDHVDKIT